MADGVLERLFCLRQRASSWRIELIAGTTTFLTMAYILFVNPVILSSGTGMDKQGLVAATCLVSALSGLMVGLFANAPIAMAPGMGLNAFFTYTLVLDRQMSWQTALGAVFLSGLLFLILTALGLRKKLVEAIPPALVSAIAVGIGLFITFIGLRNLGLVIRGSEATLVQAGPLTPTVLIGLVGLFVMIFLEARGTRGALLIGIMAATLLAVVTGRVELPKVWWSLDVRMSPVFLKLDILGALRFGVMGSVFSLMFMDMFDSIGTLVACCHQAGLVDREGRIRGLDRLLGIDALATMCGALLGTSTTTSYIESAAGIEQGGRTGLTSVVTGVLFLLSVPWSPVIAIVPPYATAPALIMVGLFMIKEVRHIDFDRLDIGFPAFMIMVMIALSYSISTGLACGFVSYVVIQVLLGRGRAVKPAMWWIALMSLAFLGLDRWPDLWRLLGH